MSPIKDRIVSTENVGQALVKVYETCSESTLRERSTSLCDAVCELIYWRYPSVETPFNEARINDAIAVLETIKGAIDEAIEAKTKARLARWDEMEGRNHG